MADFPRIVFFGTPEFAVAALERMQSAGFSVVAVVTAPDREAGRGLKKRCSPVKDFAIRQHIPVLQPLNLKDPGFLEQLDSFHPDLQVVIAFRMLPGVVWKLPVMGTFNLHASLLPQYRGAAPIQWAVINGERETGVTTFYINDQIDTGKILLSERVAIGPDETAGELHDRLMNRGAELVIRTLNQITAGTAVGISQETINPDPVVLKPAPKIFREDCRIDWNREVDAIHNFVRGLSPHPGAFTELTDANGGIQQLKILRTVPEQDNYHGSPGEIFTDGISYLKVGARNGFIHLAELQLAGRKVLNSGDFLRGFGRIFSETHGI